MLVIIISSLKYQLDTSNATSDCNKITRISDTDFDSASMPPFPNAVCEINTNIKNASMDRNTFKNGQTMMDSTTDTSDFVLEKAVIQKYLS